jgi:hypothetical protein
MTIDLSALESDACLNCGSVIVTDEPCDCRSYNGGVGTVPEVVLPSPPWAVHDHPNGVCVDTCIAEVVAALWAAGVVTLGSCCGHAGRVAEPGPTLILGDHEDPARAAVLLAELDGRTWSLRQWRLVEVTTA